MEETDVIEKKFLSALKSIYPVRRVLLAVSGGADSMAMLSLCMDYLPDLSIPFSVITVNHNIRSEEDSASDALFVASFCKKNHVSFIEKKADKGVIHSAAFARKKGIEEAARFIRYDFFEKTAQDTGASHIFLAHTKNDQLETLLQRFLQGSTSALYGIQQERKPYFRPLLHVDRRDIELYLDKKGINYCTDSTNSDNSYLRNRLRNEVIPFLSASVPGWENGALCGAAKASYDADFFNSQMQDIWNNESLECLSTSAEKFFSFHIALRIRYVYKALIILSVTQRIPFAFIEKAASGIRCETAEITFYQKKDKLYVKKLSATGKIQYFFGIIEKECSIVLDSGLLTVSASVGDEKLHHNRNNLVRLPCMIQVEHDILKTEQLKGVSSGIPVYVDFVRNNNE
ncbi:MAG TPA: tRNA lysidine(34) synthetase TilS [Treponemataceae bacterium]|nr:tRNA lysidine(34) synthetase TilS [Treponemataceae bacterium]